MLATIALTAYLLLCLAICAGVALYLAYPARGRRVPERLQSIPVHAAAARRRLPTPSTHVAPGRRARGREAAQRG